ncbi:4-hydroxy-tetrahydrodipicolinate reductase [Pikeienuella piscinae]|uniref:4-hydroxy-tetrahydrodipicolinate reductase n=1 Tax=Pikeienuella piscinae TaxID=2748098 RepID=A0A7L5BY93_9RHOB|nr:4-hydroxy-tetrahydrodipicolinate reductase [Pikeienuella piscinae]QIE56103.1 4-hydroxy-tetrahydrodipicolinate reductase [Pikeienuella piscinae]
MEPMNVSVLGCSGRMGRMLIRAVDENEGARLVGVTEREGHDWAGRDLGTCLGGPERGLKVETDPLEVFARSEAVLDFTTPAASVAHAELAAQARAVHVVGATGHEPGQLEKFTAAARHTAIVRAGNMSLGVNLLAALTRKVAAALDADFDIEIVESHHRMKIDAPSGTALMLGEAAAAGRGVALDAVADCGRDGETGIRARGHIGFAALRGGDVVGEHDVIFAGTGERLILRHIATDRMLFARGAVKAALWARGRKPGEYDMMDVLELGK